MFQALAVAVCALLDSNDSIESRWDCITGQMRKQMLLL